MATKKISELPLITTLSGSQVDGGSVLPVVVGGTTNQISVENFSRFATAYSATTASNTFSGNQNITGNVSITGVETVTGTLNVVGGGSVSGDFSVGGKLTVQELHTEVTSASILFESGSTILGNTADDTHTVTGTILLNGQALGTGQLNAYTGSLISQTTLLSTFTTSINLATASLNLQTGSQDLVNRRISSTTGSINTTTSSFDSVFQRISSTTGSINTTTSSFNSVFLGISSVTGAMNTQSSSQDLVNLGISTYTGSQNIINASVDSHILKQAIQTGSQDLVNLGISSVTGSLVGITNGLMAFTAALDSTYATDAQLYQLYQATASIQSFTSSQDTRNFTISQITSSIDAHILKQAAQTGSQDLVNLGISTYTGSQNVINSSVDSHILKQAIQTGSQDLVNLGISTYTGSQNVINNSVDAHILKQAAQTGSQDLVNLAISTYTGSQNTINNSVDSHILKQAIQTGSQDLVNLAISTYTGSNELWKAGVRGEVNGLEAYTASLKGAIEVIGQDVNVLGMITAQQFNVTYVSSSVMYKSGSNKFGNSFDDKHEFTGSIGVVGSITASGNLHANQLYIGGATTSTGLIGASEAVVQNELGVQYGDATGTYMRIIANGANSNTAIQVGAFSGADPSLDLIAAGGSTAISIKSDAGVNFGGNITGSGNLTAAKVAIGSTVKPTIPLEVYGQQKWFTTTGDSSELRGFFNPGGAADASQLTLYAADATTEGIKLNAGGASYVQGGSFTVGNSNTFYVGNSASTRIEISPDVMLATYGTSEKWKLSRDGWVSGGSAIGFGSGTTFSMVGSNAAGNALYLSANGTFGAGSAMMTIDSSGNIGAPSGTNIYNASDVRLKQNISPLLDSLSKVLQLNPVSFNWIAGFSEAEEGKELLGFVAQEVQSVIPQAIENFSNNSLNISGSIIDNPLRINEKFLIPVLTKAIQEQQTIIDSLIARIEALENK